MGRPPQAHWTIDIWYPEFYGHLWMMDTERAMTISSRRRFRAVVDGDNDTLLLLGDDGSDSKTA